RFEVPAAPAANSVRNFKSKSGTRIISLLVPLCFRSSCQWLPRWFTNFGSGALARSTASVRVVVIDPAHAATDQDVVFGHPHGLEIAAILDVGRRIARSERTLPMQRRLHIGDALLLLRRCPIGIRRRPRARQDCRRSAHRDRDAKGELRRNGHCHVSISRSSSPASYPIEKRQTLVSVSDVSMWASK